MIADKTYEKLKRMKESRGQSFTELLDSLATPQTNAQRNKELIALRGTGTFNPEEEARVKKILKEGWEKWNKKLYSTQM